MKIKYVLFDLDGTLLPMDQDAFMKAYFGGLCKKLAPYGYNPDELISAIWQGTKMMVKNCVHSEGIPIQLMSAPSKFSNAFLSIAF